MDQAHARALEALQPFIHLANSNSATSPRFIANLITNATSSPQTYVFAELLETQTVQALRSQDTPAEFQGYLKLLEVFAWGTWQEYQSTPNLPALNADQTLKLRLLSLLTLSATVNPLTYETLMASLSISSPSELESLVTTAIYSSLITARLSPASHPPMVNVISVAPLRDIKPQSLLTMISVLTEWETRCRDIIGEIESEISKITRNGKQRRVDELARAQLLEKTLASWASEGDNNLGTGGFAARKAGVQYGRKLGSAGNNGGSSNKREFSADDHDDDGYWENDGDGAADSNAGSRMDIDEGAGASRAGAAGGGARHAKRILGKKT